MTEPGADEFDVIVIGGGPAGAVCSGLLAKRGHRVLVLEKERFPRYHIGESLITGMMSVLDELGLLERIEEYGFPRKYGLSIIWGADRELWNVNFAEIGGPYEYSFHVRRKEFDELLLRRAAELGALVREEATVGEPILDGARVTGVRYRAGGADWREATARLVIDASGQSRVLTRRLAGASWAEDLRNVAHWSYFAPTAELPDGQQGNILVERVSNGWFWGIPVDSRNGTLSVGYVTRLAELNSGRADLHELFEAGLAESKQLKKLLVGSEQVGEFRTIRDWSYLSDRFSGPGWLAAGDAAGFIDPLFSGGVCLAILEADAAATAADRALRAPDTEPRELRRYDRGCRRMLADFLSYVRFFYDPTRDRESYFEQAEAMARMAAEHPAAQAAFVAVISGRTSLARLFEAMNSDEEGSPAETGDVAEPVRP